MSLSIVNNTASLNAQQSLSRTSSALNTSLQRLSTGLKINSGADGPAALVISEQQKAQIAGLQTAIDNTNKAVSVVQTGEGALNEVNSLLTQIRGLALDSANSGVNDSNALAANQAEISNALSTIDNIAKTTKFGTKNLLDGTAGISGTVSSANAAVLGQVTTGTGTKAGAYTVSIHTQGKGGSDVGVAGSQAVAGVADVLNQDGSLTVTGGGLSSGVAVALSKGDSLDSAAQKIQAALDGASSQGGGAGKFTVSVTGTVAGGNEKINIQSNILEGGTVANPTSPGITVTADTLAGSTTAAVTGFTGGQTSAAGTALKVDVTDPSNTLTTLTATAGPQGEYNQIQVGGANGLTFTVGVQNGQTAANASVSTINVVDNSLTFQIGANAGETAKVSFDNVASNHLAVGVAGLSNANTTDLSKIDVTSSAGAQDAIKVVDSAISQVSNLRGTLGAFQANTLQANAANLQTTLQNTTAAESVITDTDFASEIANYTRLQTQVQAGATVLGNANQTTQLIAQLLRG
jgi:flagellin